MMTLHSIIKLLNLRTRDESKRSSCGTACSFLRTCLLEIVIVANNLVGCYFGKREPVLVLAFNCAIGKRQEGFGATVPLQKIARVDSSSASGTLGNQSHRNESASLVIAQTGGLIVKHHPIQRIPEAPFGSYIHTS